MDKTGIRGAVKIGIEDWNGVRKCALERQGKGGDNSAIKERKKIDELEQKQ